MLKFVTLEAEIFMVVYDQQNEWLVFKDVKFTNDLITGNISELISYHNEKYKRFD